MSSRINHTDSVNKKLDFIFDYVSRNGVPVREESAYNVVKESRHTLLLESNDGTTRVMCEDRQVGDSVRIEPPMLVKKGNVSVMNRIDAFLDEQNQKHINAYCDDGYAPARSCGIGGKWTGIYHDKVTTIYNILVGTGC